MKKILVCVCLAVLAGCIEDVPERYLPEGVSKLVITSFISPDDTLLAVRVTRSEPILGVRSFTEPFEVIEDATVTITSPEERLQLRFDTDDTSGVYRAAVVDFVRPGQTYTLEVTTPGGERATATCRVPLATDVPTPELRLDTIVEDWGGGPTLEQRLNVFWTDAPGLGDYYRVWAQYAFESKQYVYFQGQIYDSVWVSQISEIYFEEAGAVSDAGGDGQRYAVRNGYLGWFGEDAFARNPRATVYLLRTDEDYYRYHRSLELFNRADGNPFAEPAPLYSNVEGGLGVFASYLSVGVEVPL
ncbi:MAG: DUF4249 domain-containing protein [Catalinimonas sp.]